MTPLFTKLNYKGQEHITLLNAPPSFEPELAALSAAIPALSVDRNAESLDAVDFGLAFARTKAELDGVSKALSEKARGDALLWLAYPKQSSKLYVCDFNRDQGWDVLESAGFRPVRQVAIDEDWSALRWRKSSYIKRS
ncbi:MAG TPA: hypothetical protein DCG47_13065 [Spirochaetaceae bacterium]|jgi:hypothetical protein|nr:hypothetical protein [Spirochaetaceae bacterium]